MPDAAPDSAVFRKAYVEAEKAPAVSPSRSRPGSLAAAIEGYQGSAHFLSRADSTRGVWRRYFSDMVERYGRIEFSAVSTRHLKKDLSQFDPHPANNRLKAWKALFRWLESTGRIDVDPARPIRKFETPRTEGHAPWSRQDFVTFREHWALDTPQRLALEVLYRSCAAMVDATKLGPGMSSDGWLIYERQKSGSVAAVPWTSSVAPEWFEWNDDLEAALSAQEKHMTYLVTALGRPRSEKAASAWFSRACTSAGLPHLSAHGVRKGRAAIFRENGATQDQRMAVLGHETEEEATHYSRSADLKRVISGTKVPTSVQKLENWKGKAQ